MPKIKAETVEGNELHVHVPQFVSWILSLASIAMVAGTALLINLNLRVSVIESTRFTSADAVILMGDVVPRSEYEAVLSNFSNDIERLEGKVDRLLERE